MQPSAGFDGTITGTLETTTVEAASIAGGDLAGGVETNDDNNVDVDTYNLTIVVGPDVGDPTVAIGVDGGDFLVEDTPGALAFSAAPTQPDDTLTEIKLSNISVDWTVDLSSLTLTNAATNTPLVLGVDYTVAGDPQTGELIITLLTQGEGEGVTGTIGVTPGPENSDVDGQASIEATAVDGALSASNGTTEPVVVDAVVDGSEVTGDALDSAGGVQAAEDTPVALGLQIELGNDSTTSVGGVFDSQGGTDVDGTESVTLLVLALTGDAGAVLVNAVLPTGVNLPAPTVAGDTVTYTVDTSTWSLAEVQAFVAGLTVQPSAGFDGTISGTLTTTTEEAATEAGGDPAGGQEGTDANNVDVDVYDLKIVIDPDVGDPDVAIGVDGGDFLFEDTPGALAFSAAPTQADDTLTEIKLSNISVDWTVDLNSLTLTNADDQRRAGSGRRLYGLRRSADRRARHHPAEPGPGRGRHRHDRRHAGSGQQRRRRPGLDRSDGGRRCPVRIQRHDRADRRRRRRRRHRGGDADR